MKISILLTGLAIIGVLTVLYFNVEKKPTDTAIPTATTTTDSTDMTAPPEQPTGKIKADTFTGILENVDIGCFSDGECAVTVDGKHVTLLIGRSQEVVGSIIGAPSIGDLEAYIGKPVEVYARDNSDGTYSLYGSVGFHVKVLPDTASSTLPSTQVGSTTTTTGACVVGGCSSELCTDAHGEAVVSTCMYRAEYACYKNAECKRQTDGQCGWSKTPTLNACIKSANTAEPIAL